MPVAPQPAEAVALRHTVAVAFSGGRDSLALLHATCRAAPALGLRVAALHIHHGLLPEADGWLQRAQRLCARWRRRGWPVDLHWARLAGQPAPGDSLEAWARAGRYAALTRLAQQAGATLVLLAHHRRDQAETLLLQALRGGGPEGLSAMPVSVQRGGLRWVRPWLAQPASSIDSYVQRHHLQPVLDPSNADPALARSRLRTQVWPALHLAFANAEATLAAAAQRAQESAAALAELADADLSGCVEPAGGLRAVPWRQLSPARQANALRHWWRQQAGRGAPETLLRRLLAEVPARGTAQWPAGGGRLCLLHRGVLRLVDTPAAGGPGPVQQLDLSLSGLVPAPGWGGAFVLTPVVQGGVATSLLAQVQLRPRRGGERFQHAPRSLPRSLKKQFQAAGLPAMARGGPLLWSADGRLLFVPGLGPDARCLAAPGAAQLAICWHADTAVSAPHQPAG